MGGARRCGQEVWSGGNEDLPGEEPGQLQQRSDSAAVGVRTEGQGLRERSVCVGGGKGDKQQARR